MKDAAKIKKPDAKKKMEAEPVKEEAPKELTEEEKKIQIQAQLDEIR